MQDGGKYWGSFLPENVLPNAHAYAKALKTAKEEEKSKIQRASPIAIAIAKDKYYYATMVELGLRQAWDRFKAASDEEEEGADDMDAEGEATDEAAREEADTHAAAMQQQQGEVEFARWSFSTRKLSEPNPPFAIDGVDLIIADPVYGVPGQRTDFCYSCVEDGEKAVAWGDKEYKYLFLVRCYFID